MLRKLYDFREFDVTRATLPQGSYYSNKNMELFVFVNPCKGEIVSGDLISVVKGKHGEKYILLYFDATGHGIKPALYAAAMNEALKAQIEKTPDSSPGELIKDVFDSLDQTKGQRLAAKINNVAQITDNDLIWPGIGMIAFIENQQQGLKLIYNGLSVNGLVALKNKDGLQRLSVKNSDTAIAINRTDFLPPQDISLLQRELELLPDDLLIITSDFIDFHSVPNELSCFEKLNDLYHSFPRDFNRRACDYIKNLVKTYNEHDDASAVVIICSTRKLPEVAQDLRSTAN